MCGTRSIGWNLAGPAMVLLGCAGADAAAIHRHGAGPSAVPQWSSPTAEPTPVMRQWSHYLIAGPKTWAHAEHPAWTESVRHAAMVSVHQDPGRTDLMANFLLWRQSLDPARFNHYHPGFVRALHRITMLRSRMLAPSQGPATSSPGGPSTCATISPQDATPPTVPEPGSLLLAAGLSAWCVRRMRRA